ncbi:hypothetical protein FLONG3_5291 [Fusarium longipes]|uniref:Uncharacterized protein n=1 Tax=Fusarium longipes TaxID=694270 RepID=A0A395SW50_9HYPO|nr:hypothetical protein FLONG3_5291 [Fusarium longipes]
MPRERTNRRTDYRVRPYESWNARHSQPALPFPPLNQDDNSGNQDALATDPSGHAGGPNLHDGMQASEETIQQDDMGQQDTTPGVTADDIGTGPNQPPRGPRFDPRQRFYASHRTSRHLTMVDSMMLQSVGRAGSWAPPGLAIHSNSRGGGIQQDIFTKVPATSKTIAYSVDCEETLLQAYRQVKAMNPSAAVGGIMFSVAPKTASPFTEIDNVHWRSLTGRRSFSSSFTAGPGRPFRSKFTFVEVQSTATDSL